MKKLLVILISAVSLNGIAQENPKHLNVLAMNGLNMRSQPDSKARVVTKVDYGKRVEVMQKTKTELQLGWIKDNWFKVKYRGREGYIFGGYMSQLTPPTGLESVTYISDLLPIYCNTVFEKQKAPIITKEKLASGDTLIHTLTNFKGGQELEMEFEGDRRMSKLLVDQSVADLYVLLEAMLKQSGQHELLDELRFIEGKNGELSRLSTSDGTISIRVISDDLTELKLVSYSPRN